MALDVNEIRAALRYGGARPSKFQVQLTNPINGSSDPISPFFIQAASLPAYTIGQIEVPYQGRKIKVNGDRTFDIWQVQVLNDEDFAIRHALEEWHHSLNELRGNRALTTNNYKSVADVIQLSQSGEQLRRYKFFGLWPVEIGQIDLDWNASDQLEVFSVAFAYDWFEPDGGVTGTISG